MYNTTQSTIDEFTGGSNLTKLGRFNGTNKLKRNISRGDRYLAYTSKVAYIILKSWIISGYFLKGVITDYAL
jgi:hypothetical protein